MPPLSKYEMSGATLAKRFCECKLTVDGQLVEPRVQRINRDVPFSSLAVQPTLAAQVNPALHLRIFAPAEDPQYAGRRHSEGETL
jgi:hypothetical protein